MVSGRVPRVLILSAGDGHAALAAARSLAAAGHDVGVGGTGGGPWASRVVRGRHVVPAPEAGREPFLRALRDAIRAGGYEVVFGAGDDWMAALSQWRDDVDATVGHPSADVVLRSLDKVEVVELGRAAGLSVPRTEAGSADASAWPDGAVVKCRRHWLPGRTGGDGRLEAGVAGDPDGVQQLASRIAAAGGEPVVQEAVTGRLMSVVVFVVDGRAVLRLQQVASGTWPSPAGVTTRAETVAIDEALAAAVDRLVLALGWSGILQVELVLPAGAAPVLIDLNGRFYGSMALAVAAGLDLPGAAVDLALRAESPVPRDAEVGVRYQWLEGDVRRALHERRGGLVADVRDTVRAMRGASGPVGLRQDPGPAWWRARRVLAEVPRRVVRR